MQSSPSSRGHAGFLEDLHRQYPSLADTDKSPRPRGATTADSDALTSVLDFNDHLSDARRSVGMMSYPADGLDDIDVALLAPDMMEGHVAVLREKVKGLSREKGTTTQISDSMALNTCMCSCSSSSRAHNRP